MNKNATSENGLMDKQKNARMIYFTASQSFGFWSASPDVRTVLVRIKVIDPHSFDYSRCLRVPKIRDRSHIHPHLRGSVVRSTFCILIRLHSATNEIPLRFPLECQRTRVLASSTEKGPLSTHAARQITC